MNSQLLGYFSQKKSQFCALLPQKKEESLMKGISSSLINQFLSSKKISVNSSKEELTKRIKESNKKLDGVSLSCFYRLTLKIGALVSRLLFLKNSVFSRAVDLDQLLQDLKKKQIEVLNFRNNPKISKKIESYLSSPNIPATVKIGILEVQKLEAKLYLAEMLNIKKELRKTNLSAQDQLKIFKNMPVFFQNKILEYGKLKKLSKKETAQSLKSLLSDPYGAHRSFSVYLESIFANEIKSIDSKMNTYKAELLDPKKDPIFSKNSSGVSNERFTIDASSEILTKDAKTRVLEKPIHVAMVSVEYSGLIKEGGLAEAVEGLSKALKEKNKDNKVTLVYPKFSSLPPSILEKLKDPIESTDQMGNHFKVYKLALNGVEIHFIEHKDFELPEKTTIYGGDHISRSKRFATFNSLAADYLYGTIKSDVIHLHDWHVAGIGLKLEKDHKKEWDQGKIAPVVFTFHNNMRDAQGRLKNQQGAYSYDGLENAFIENGIVNNTDNLFVKAIQNAAVVTTVSEMFAQESQTIRLGEGVSFAVREAAKNGKFFGILNGTNPHSFNPEKDATLVGWKDIETSEPLDLSYGPSTKNLIEKRTIAKHQLKLWVEKYFEPEKKKKIDFDFTKPYVTYIGRYSSYQKGLDKFEEAIEATIKNGGQFVCVGTGEDEESTRILDRIEKKYKKGVLVIRDFRDDKTKKFYYQQGSDQRPGVGPLIRACSDFMFVPSRFEPCGLVQFEGWLFGSLAIGSKTGGLADTIVPQEDSPNGYNGFLFCRQGEYAKNCQDTIKEALEFWKTSSNDQKNGLINRLITEGRKYGWDGTHKKYSPVDRYRLVYDMAQKVQRGAKVDLPERDLIFQPYESAQAKEENYLYHYYNAKNLGISSEELEKLFLKLPAWCKAEVPKPYGVGIEYLNHKVFGAKYDRKTKATSFSVFAPKAKKVSLVLYDSDENMLKEHTMTLSENGTWVLNRLKDVKPGQKYQYKIDGKLKIDPYSKKIDFSKKAVDKGFSVVQDEVFKPSENTAWINQRLTNTQRKKPINIYEIHPTTWKKKEDGSYMNYKEMALELAKHAKENGFTHVELMGILDHPNEGSWGYQATGFFAPNHRLGSLDDLKFMVHYLHEQNIGVILDFVPGHFANDSYGLKEFDGSNLYQPNKLSSLFSLRKWFYSFGSSHFDFSKKHVRDFLLSSAYFWLKDVGFDGLRVDCVASILRSEDPNSGALFLKDLNAMVHKEVPGAITIAEDFSGNSNVLNQLSLQGLGFDFKWNTAWNHFALKYFASPNSVNPSESNYSLISKALIQPNSKQQIAFLSHDETNLERAEFYKHLNSLDEKERLKRIKSFLSFLFTSSQNHLLFSGIENMNTSPWDQLIGKSQGLMESNPQNQEHQAQIKKMLLKLKEIESSEISLREADENTLELISDPTHRVHAVRKNFESHSTLLVHNLTSQEHEGFKVKIKKSKELLINPQVVFSSNDKDFGGDGKEATLVKTEENDEFYIYTVKVPPQTTLFIKES